MVALASALSRHKYLALALLVLDATIAEALALGMLFAVTLQSSSASPAPLNLSDGRSIFIELFAILIACGALFTSTRMALSWEALIVSAWSYIATVGLSVIFALALLA